MWGQETQVTGPDPPFQPRLRQVRLAQWLYAAIQATCGEGLLDRDIVGSTIVTGD